MEDDEGVFREKMAERKRHRLMTEAPQAQAGSHYLAGYKAAMQDAFDCYAFIHRQPRHHIGEPA